jgi:hypothetical protein
VGRETGGGIFSLQQPLHRREGVACRHEHESGCTVREAVEAVLLSEKHLAYYQRLIKELEFQTYIELKRLEKKRYEWMRNAARRFREDKGG